MKSPKLVIDTNVFYSALRSKKGASFKLLSLIGGGLYEANISVPLILEYEEIAKRNSRQLGLSFGDIDDILDYVCKVSGQHNIFFLWRPYLKDCDDDLILELGVKARCGCIITYNKKDFKEISQFGLKVMSPKEILIKMGVIK